VRTPWSEFWRKFRGSTSRSLAGAFVLSSRARRHRRWIAPFDRRDLTSTTRPEHAAVGKIFGVDSLAATSSAGC
jgi:glutathione transport system permease protein